VLPMWFHCPIILPTRTKITNSYRLRGTEEFVSNTAHIARPYPQFPFFSYIKGRDLRFRSHNWILNQSGFTKEKYRKLKQQQWWWCTFSRRCRSEVLNWRTPLPLDVGSIRCAFSKAWYRPVIQSTTNDNSAQIKSISMKTRIQLINQGF
jgi:hypothetical protein